MAEWKKVIVSGSSPEFAAVTVDGAVSALSFSGDGSGLTGVAAGSIDIDAFSAGTVLGQTDNFLYSDGGTEKKITFSALEDAVFGNVSGDATIAAGGALTIAAGAVENSMLAGSIANNKLTNSAITIAGTSTSLGGSITAATILEGTGTISGSAQITITESQISDLSHYTDSDADARIAAASVTDLSDVSSAGSGAIITSAERTKLTGIEASADVTDTTNVRAAGALMDDEVTNLAEVKAFSSADYATAAQGTKADAALPEADVDADIKTLSLPANTTISAFGASLVDDANASAARTTLGVDAAGTDNSTDVTIAAGRNYVTISGQELTLGVVDISDDTNLTAGTGVTLTGDTLSIGQSVGTSDSVTFGGVTVNGDALVTGDLAVQGTLTSIQTTNLNVEDQLVLLGSGSADARDVGFVFGGSNGTANRGDAFFYDMDADRPAWSSNDVAWNATAIVPTAYIPRVYDVDGASHVPVAEAGSIKIEGGVAWIYA